MYCVAFGNLTAQTGRRVADSRRGGLRKNPVHVRLTLLLLTTLIALPLAAEAKLFLDIYEGNVDTIAFVPIPVDIE